MKDKKGKKIASGLASIFLFFGKNVYATSSDTSSSSSTFGVVIGAIFLIAVLALGYKMDKNAEKSPETPKAPKPPKEPKAPKVPKEKKEKKPKEPKATKLPKFEKKEKVAKEEKAEKKVINIPSIDDDDDDIEVPLDYVIKNNDNIENDFDVPYEEEKNESYVADQVSKQDLNEETEYEDDINTFTNMYDDYTDSNFDVEAEIDSLDEEPNEEETLKTEDDADYSINDLNAKIDELDELDEDYINEKISEFQNSNEKIENPSEFLNNLKKYERDADNFEGFSVKEEPEDYDDNEVDSFSFGGSSSDFNSTSDFGSTSKNSKKYTRKKSEIESQEENETPSFDNSNSVEEVNDVDFSSTINSDDFSFSSSNEPTDVSFTKDETNLTDDLEENTESKLDIGFLNQMEQNLMKNQEERNSKKNKK
jgi:hypothetical protein